MCSITTTDALPTGPPPDLVSHEYAACWPDALSAGWITAVPHRQVFAHARTC
jgi:hypothetical protein